MNFSVSITHVTSVCNVHVFFSSLGLCCIVVSCWAWSRRSTSTVFSASYAEAISRLNSASFAIGRVRILHLMIDLLDRVSSLRITSVVRTPASSSIIITPTRQVVWIIQILWCRNMLVVFESWWRLRSWYIMTTSYSRVPSFTTLLTIFITNTLAC